MLMQLTVANYAIAEHIELHFEPGMTTLTGETGAGKSIVLDALGLTLGDRADAGTVRHGAERADITATFDIQQHVDAQTWLQEHDLDTGQECILRRVITRDGRSRSYINGAPCPIQDLRQLGSLLIDIHSQHQHQSLLRKDNHRRLVDEFAGAQSLAIQVQTTFRQWQKLKQQWNAIQSHQDERDARLQLLRYQVEELDRLTLDASEIPALEQEQITLANAGETLNACHLAVQLCTDAEPGAVERIRDAMHQLEQLPGQLPVIAEALSMLETARIQLEEAASNLRHFADDFDLDPQRLKEVEDRLSVIYQLARKHRVNPEELPALHQQLATELSELDGGGTSLEHVEQELISLQQTWTTLAQALSERRAASARLFDERIGQELQRLSMPSVCFVTSLSRPESSEPQSFGNEEIEFLVSANPGQPPRPLAKVASGGELSRISLAIQVVAAQTSTIPTLIFDEVDVGIGGATAEVVGRLLRALGARGQILCVTHLPQVAAQAHQHLFVSKAIRSDSTYSSICKLDEAGRISEVARMLGGLDLTEQTLAHAREMYDRGQVTHH